MAVDSVVEAGAPGASGGRRHFVTRREWPRVSVIVPTLNEARNLPHVFAELPEGLHEVIVVDGRSTDGTPEVARALRSDVVVVDQTGRGKGNALQAGFAAATGDVLVMLDADGSADPAEIPAFVGALLAGADFAKGSRFGTSGGSADITGLRRGGNRFLSGLVNTLFKTGYSDLCYGYNAFWRHCLPAMSVDCDGFEVETLINIRIARAGLEVWEVPSFERARIHGESNLRTFRDGGRVLRTIIRERMRPAPPLGEPVAREVVASAEAA
jgi:glycosyltransferase involved in cell wall biosynthesis